GREKRVNIAVRTNDKTVFSWGGHAGSVFGIETDRLFYADFKRYTAGGVIRAVDLKTGKELWMSPLRAVTVAGHSLYSNRIMMEVHEGAIILYGNESGGCYIEI